MRDTFEEESPKLTFPERLKLVAVAIIAAAIGQLVLVGLYYLILETYAPITHAWHLLVPDKNLRHALRNNGEGLFGGLFAVRATWWHYKKEAPIRPSDRAEDRLNIPNLKFDQKQGFRRMLLGLILVIPYAAPGFVVTRFIVEHLQEFVNHGILPHLRPPALTGSIGKRMWTVATGEWPQKAIGYGAAFFFGRRPMKAVFDYAQLRSISAHIKAKKKPGRFWLPNYRRRYLHVLQHPELAVRVRFARIKRLISIGPLLVAVGLAVYGWVVLNKIAA